jgi:hypothetical protein
MGWNEVVRGHGVQQPGAAWASAGGVVADDLKFGEDGLGWPGGVFDMLESVLQGFESRAF